MNSKWKVGISAGLITGAVWALEPDRLFSLFSVLLLFGGQLWRRLKPPPGGEKHESVHLRRRS